MSEASSMDCRVGHPEPERGKWRLLERGEKIQPGDQGLNDDCETWHDVERFFCNIPYNPGFFVPFRRKQPNTTNEPPAGSASITELG